MDILRRIASRVGDPNTTPFRWEDVRAQWAARDTSGDDRFLDELGGLLGGRMVKDADGRTQSIRLPRRLATGDVFFVWGGDHDKAILVELKLGSSLNLAFGAKPLWSGASARIEGEASPIHFDPAQVSAESVRTWLAAGGSAAIRELSLAPEDYVEIWETKTAFAGHPATPPEIHEKTLALIALVHSLPRPSVRQRHVRLPAGFAALQSLTPKWVLSDDQKRAETIARANLSTLRRLVDAVSPRFGEIDSVLDATGEPLSDDLVALQTLAEAAAEAQLELERRASSDIHRR